MRLPILRLSNLAAYFSILILLYGFWAVDNTIMSVLLILSLISLIHFYFVKSETLNVTLLDIAILFLAIIEVISYLTSIYKPNSFIYLFKFFFMVLFYFYLRFTIKTENHISTIYKAIYYYGLILNICCVFIFITHHVNISIKGFSDITQFRYLFRPFGYQSNDWATVQLLFIPFSIIPLLNERKRLYYLIPLAIVLLASLTSFSRGVYLAIATFFLVSNLLLIIIKIVSFKRLIILNLFACSLFVLFFSLFPKSAESTFLIHKSISHQRSVKGRINVWKETPQLLRAINRISGIGSKNFPLKSISINSNDESRYFTSRVSNSLLQILIEKGIFGLIAYTFMLVALLWNTYKMLPISKQAHKISIILFVALLISVIVRELTFSSIFEKSSIMILLMIIFTTISANYGVEYRRKNKEVLNKRFFLITGIVIIALSIILLIKNIYVSHAKTLNKQAIAFYEKQNKIQDSINLSKSAIKLDSKNAIYYSNLGLFKERQLNTKFIFSYYSATNYQLSQSNFELIENAIFNFEKALKLSPEDACFYHNLGWLYYLRKDTSAAKSYFLRATELDPNTALYHISLGIYCENQSQLEHALCEYRTAIRLSPDIIESKFFIDLKQRFPAEAFKLIQENISILEERVEIADDMILKAKLAKLYFNSAQIDKSFSLFNEITNTLPNLGRPWLYLGDIYRTRKDSILAEKMYKNAIFLDRRDFLPCQKLGDYYQQNGDKKYAAYYLTRALENWRNVYSQHSIRCQRIYNTVTINNNIIPNGLLHYTKPNIDLEETSSNISKLYAEIDKLGSSEKYNRSN